MSGYLAELMEGSRNLVKNAAKVKRGEAVVIVSDTSVDPIVTEAVFLAAEEAAGPTVGVINLKGMRTGISPREFDKLRNIDWWPKFVMPAMLAADVAIRLSFWPDLHVMRVGSTDKGIEFFKKHNTRYVRAWRAATPKRLASTWAKFPYELLMAIGKKSFAPPVTGGRVVRVTDPEGTDITFEGYDMLTTEELMMGDYFVIFQEVMPGLTPKQNARGTIVTNRLHTGFIDPMKLTFEDGRCIKIEGGGPISESWLSVFEQYKDESWGIHPGPGINWLEECMWGVSPKGPLGRAAGQLHFAVGGGLGVSGQHRDVEILYPTLTIDGKTIIENGHLLILDDPEIRGIAAKYGDPDDLLILEPGESM